MKETMHLTDDIAILNFDLALPTTKSGLIKSPEFRRVMLQYMKHLEKKDPDLYQWACAGRNEEEAAEELCRLARTVIVFDMEEIENPYLDDTDSALQFVEGMFDFWRDHQRYSVTTNRVSDTESAAFVERDSHFNDLVRNTFRQIEQTLSGRINKVLRQQQSGTNAGIACYYNESIDLSERYSFLKEIMFIDSVMLRTPTILHPRSNKREGMFEEVAKNPAFTFDADPSEYFCYPAKVGGLMFFICFHRDYMANGISCANLFELATAEEAAKRPDGIVIFGNPDGQEKCTFYHDQDEDLWVGSVSSGRKVEYFGYMKKMVLTLHNVAMMDQGWLPIHGAFINVVLKDGRQKGICLMGDSGAGKSETIEALKSLASDEIKRMEIIFDDMGTFHLENGIPVAQGTEIGAFIRLDDLDPGAPYRDIHRSIFFNPDQSNARVITPAAPYSLVTQNHTIDLFAYANNYDDAVGLRRIDDLEEAKEIFVRGRRMAKGTTQETGLSETYFANPFGPMQQQEICGPIIDEVFEGLQRNNVFIGEAFTHLGLDPEGDEIRVAAQALLEFIRDDQWQRSPAPQEKEGSHEERESRHHKHSDRQSDPEYRHDGEDR